MDEGWRCILGVCVGGQCMHRVWGCMHEVLGGCGVRGGGLREQGGKFAWGNRAVLGCEHTQPQGALPGCTVLSSLPVLTWELHRALLGSLSTLCPPALRNHSAKVHAVLLCVQPWRSKAKSSCMNSEQDAIREIAGVLLVLPASFLLL